MLYRFTEGLPSNLKALAPLMERRQGALLLRLYGPKTDRGPSRPRDEDRLPLFHTSEKVLKTVLRFSKRDRSHASMECCLGNWGMTYEKTLTMLRTSIPIRLFPLSQRPLHKPPTSTRTDTSIIQRTRSREPPRPRPLLHCAHAQLTPPAPADPRSRPSPSQRISVDLRQSACPARTPRARAPSKCRRPERRNPESRSKGSKLSMAVTRWPPERRRQQRCPPMKPSPPVTQMCRSIGREEKGEMHTAPACPLDHYTNRATINTR